MNTLVVLAALFGIAVAIPIDQTVSVTQDTLGNYNLKYAIDGISRSEQRDAFGNVVGGYSYVDPHGVLRKIAYTSGEQGFQPIGTDIPAPIQDTPEVILAKNEHLAVLRSEGARPLIPEFQGPSFTSGVRVAEIPVARSAPFVVPLAQPIQQVVHVGAIPDTPEVIAARAEHFAAHAAARANLLLHQ